jgi:hypothetical protein
VFTSLSLGFSSCLFFPLQLLLAAQPEQTQLTVNSCVGQVTISLRKDIYEFLIESSH